MSYLWIRNWDRFQHYKDRKPVWIKFYVDLLDDPELREMRLETRLLWDQLLLLAARYGNPIEDDHEAIAKLTRMPTRSVREGVRELAAKRLVKQTRTRRKPPQTNRSNASEPASNLASEPASTHARPCAGSETETEKETTTAEQKRSKTTAATNGDSRAALEQAAARISALHGQSHDQVD